MTIGNDFRATTTFRLTSQCGISIGKHVRCAWDCLFMDSDYHFLKNIDGSETKGYGAIEIGSFIWFGNGCRITKGVKLPNYVTVCSGTWLIGKQEIQEYSVIGNEKAIRVVANGMWLDPNDCDITDYSL